MFVSPVLENQKIVLVLPLVLVLVLDFCTNQVWLDYENDDDDEDDSSAQAFETS